LSPARPGDHMRQAEIKEGAEGLTESLALAGGIAGWGAVLEAAPLFGGMTRAEGEAVAWRAQEWRIAAGRLLYMEGRRAVFMGLILRGRVRVTRLLAFGNEMPVWTLGTGDAVGVLHDAATGAHCCSARAVEECVALVWERERLESSMEEYPGLKKNVEAIRRRRRNELEEGLRGWGRTTMEAPPTHILTWSRRRARLRDV